MLGMEEWMEVKDLKRQGHSIKEICRRTSYSRNTVRKVLREAGPIRRSRMLKGGTSMIKRFSSKFGMFLSAGYSAICLFTVLSLIISPPDSMSMLALIVITLPWSLLLLELGSQIMGTASDNLASAVGPLIFVLLFALSATINATILYLVGWLITSILAKFNKVEKD
jgi:hypothetical protein